MKKKLKYSTLAIAGALSLMGLGVVAVAVGSGLAGYGMPYKYPEGCRDKQLGG